jgi:hypothetical protein
MGAAVAVEENVAVGRRLGDAARAGRAAGAANILDDDLLAEQFAHGGRENPCRYIDRAAGGEGHHHRDGARRPVLRRKRMNACKHDGERDARSHHHPAPSLDTGPRVNPRSPRSP